MKAKLQITATFLLFLSSVSGQEYYPLFDTSSWVVYDLVSCCRESITHTISDGVEESMTSGNYRKIHDPFEFYGNDTIYVREDIAARKIYRLVDGADRLIYDFSLEQGDTITLANKTFEATVDQVMTQAGPRKRIVLNTVVTYNNFTLTQTWIEGVGTIAHPFYPDSNMYNQGASGGGLNFYTRCSFQKQVHIFGEPEQCETFMSVPKPSGDAGQISVVPNPVVSDISVTSTYELNNASFMLYDLTGQLLREGSNISGKGFSQARENLGSGIYFLHIFQDGVQLLATKVILN